MHSSHRNFRGRSSGATACALLVYLLLQSGCAASRPAPPGEEAALIAWAREGFAAGDYRDVLTALQAFLPGHAGSRYTEEASLIMGRCQYELEMSLEAEDQFRKLLHDFPGGEFAPEATYYLGLSLLAQSRGPQLDQTETRDALAQFRSFLSRYPGHALAPRAEEHVAAIRDRLAEKEYLNGRLYYKRGIHRAARFYFEEKVVKEYGDTRWACPARLYTARSYEETKEWTQAATWSQEILDRCPDADEAPPARRLLAKAQEQLKTAPLPPPTDGTEITGSSGPR
jgi:outer membrane protein assembly factor BamD